MSNNHKGNEESFNVKKAPVKKWVADSLDRETRQAIERLSILEDVTHVAIMPDVHSAGKTCVGSVVATNNTLYPEIVGSDIGCGISAIKFDLPAEKIDNETIAKSILQRLRICVPANRHSAETVGQIPPHLVDWKLSAPELERLKLRDGKVQFGTLGRGNHFLEFQSDQDGQLWMMVHSGSRGMGAAISEYHLQGASQSPHKLVALAVNSRAGEDYLNDLKWAIQYARFNRRFMIASAAEIIRELGGEPIENSRINTDHNHVRSEPHFGQSWWVHRKGAQRLPLGRWGLIPGSMGTESFHVTGRGCEEGLLSASHGAGRAMKRSDAARKISKEAFRGQMAGVWFDDSRSKNLIDEAPAAYKDIRRVMRAQKKLVRIERTLQPVLIYKGR